MLLEPGHVIEGKYRLIRVIGTGGMGAVYEGENVLIRRRVAIKVLHGANAADSDAVRRFEREAQAAGEIGNDHILEVLDLGSLPNGDRYLVMEYLDGETLAARIERLGRLTPAQIAPVARQFLEALVCAHAAGIIHRDLKPENIFILRSKAGRADFVKLIDFGISKFTRPFEQGEHRMTRADTVLGTPCYMSPEQARGASGTDVRSDIYSCGVILYEAVTGQLPFDGKSFNELMFKIALQDAPSPTSLVPDLDREFAAIVSHAIERDPNKRFPSAQKFAEAIDAWMTKSGLAGAGDVTPPPPSSEPMPRGLLSRDARTLSMGEAVASTVLKPVGPDLRRTPIDLRKTGTEESWAQSKAETLPSARGRVLAAAAAGLLIVGIGVAVLERPVAPPAVQHVSTSLSAPATAVEPVASSVTAPAPAAPAPSSRPEAPTANSLATTKHEAAAKQAGARPPASTARPKAKPPATSKGFDLGY